MVLLLCVSFATVVYSQNPVESDDALFEPIATSQICFYCNGQATSIHHEPRAEDLRVLEDGTAQQVFTFQREADRPLALALLIDVSGSEERTLPQEKAAARLFIERVLKSDRARLQSFPSPTCHFSNNLLPAMFLASIGRSSVWRLLCHTSARVDLSEDSQQVRNAGSARTRLDCDLGIVTPNFAADPRPHPRSASASDHLTDGWDTAVEGRVTRSQAIESVLSAEAVIYAIGIGDSKQDGVDKGTLRDIAERTGGRAFFPKKEEDLNKAFAEIEQELRTQYLLAYASTNKNRDGSYRQVTIKIANPLLIKDKVQLRHKPELLRQARALIQVPKVKHGS